MNTMKYIFLGFSILFCAVVLVSCEDFLTKSPESNISEEEAFENFANFQGYVEELYSTIPDFTNAYWTNNWNWGDDVVTSEDMNYHVVDMFDDGNFWGWQSEHNGWNTSWMDAAQNADPSSGNRHDHELWNHGWYGLRKANVGLNNLDKFQGTEQEKDLIEGQLLFFRGWYHFQFMQYFGGLPYMSEPLPADAQFDQTRLDYQALADSVAQDFRRAADLLPVDWNDTAPGARTSGNNELRINKVMALAYLGKDLLWAASPLMNNGSDENAGSYNQEFAQRSADAFGELLNLVESGQANYELVDFSEFHTLFYTTGQNWQMPGGNEAIFRGPYWDANGSNWGTSKQYMPTVIGDGSNIYPTANYAENFGMANGLPLDAQGSGYSESHPWQDRDPRFYKTFVYDGLQVVQGTMPGNEEQNRYANLFTGGNYRFANGNSPGGSQTGYVLRKFIPLTANKYDNGYSFGANLNVHLPWMRLAEVYIMYAEAAAVANQSATGSVGNFNMTAEEAINKVRDRAGVPPVDSRYLDDVNDFLGEVRREWAVELAFEKHRFTNLRRWLLLTDDRYANKTAIHFDRAPGFDPDNPRDNEVLNLREEVIVERNYSQRHYWLPLKRADVNISSSFTQNPGW
ncbi:RagB/SusD family nutrient uptake outer membrane protein [Aliifodinibius sp. S!AR15-10]|uniref:RagB/SusD family nutrient uptake outer membrane protein n=1 Tax=Aliifodinibius sp. S!AR15-10 TaxID=2950437 RepID=UPI00286519D5|nr:RagB/SusD family nutrient uptake outer membrane protein [Aliifodinibius sp. S!AR15-10]MDR8393362.1 RagB/SusD family nutrient uptake outer membrane protein [Aliifodinibius sp. S!AR15-10]